MSWKRYFQRARWDEERARELEVYLEMETEANLAAGMEPREARDAARRKLGSRARIQEEIHEMNSVAWVENILRDLRYAARALRKSPGFFITATLTLALGIGANTAIFSFVDAVLLRPLPYPEPDKLAKIALEFRGKSETYLRTAHTGALWEVLRGGTREADVAIYSEMTSGVNLALPGQGRAEFVQQQRVGEGYFRILGVAPLFGRGFNSLEDREGGPPAVVLSHALCARLTACSAGVLGQSIHLKGEPFVIVGVMPPGFRTGNPVDLWTPLRPSPTGEGSGTNYAVFARLRPGVNWQQAGAGMEALSASLPVDREDPSRSRGILRLLPLQKGMTDGIRQPLLILWGAVGVVLLIACVNIASLLLARGGARARELATRLALGCGRAGIVRQLLAESLLIGLAGAAVGLVLGLFAMRGMLWLSQDMFPLWTDVTLDSRVLAVTSLIALITSLLFGIAPALHFSRLDIHPTLVESGGRGHAGRSRHWSQRMLVVSEVALGVVLLVSAGLLIRTFTHLRGLKPGFDPTHVQTARISLQDARYAKSEPIVRLFEEGVQRLRRIDGVVDAAVVLGLPYERVLNTGFRRIDGPNVNDGRNEITNLCYVTPAFFEVLRIPLRKGRLLRESDGTGAPPAIVVNESFVRTYLPNQEPVGSHLRMGGKEIWTIVGVVGDVQQRPGWGSFGPLAPMPLTYITPAQMSEKAMVMIHTWFTPNWVVRTRQDQSATMAAIQQTLAGLDPLLPVAPLQPIARTQSDALQFERFLMSLLSGLAALALILASVGLYGLISNSVQERTRELGIRLALGASLGRTIWSVLGPVGLLVVVGTGAGVVLSAFATRVLKSMLWGVTASDPWTFAGVGLTLLAVAALAALVPTLRITRLDPAQTLRHE